MGNFYQWLETNVGDIHHLTIQRKPAETHPITYDHAWEKHDKEKDQFLESIHQTASKFIRLIRNLSHNIGDHHIYLHEKNKYVLKEIPINIGQRIENYLFLISHLLYNLEENSIAFDKLHHEDEINTHYQNAHTYKHPNFNFDFEQLEYLNKNKLDEIVYQYLHPSAIQIIDKVTSWLNQLAIILKFSGPTIDEHKFKKINKSKVSDLAEDVITKVTSFLKSIPKDIPLEFKNNILKQLSLDENFKSIYDIKEENKINDKYEVAQYYNIVLSWYPTFRDTFPPEKVQEFRKIIKSVSNLVLVKS